MNADARDGVLREVRANLRAHPRQALVVMAVVGLCLSAVGASLQWWALVDRALQVSGGTLSPAGQAPLQPYVVAAAALGAVATVSLVCEMAHTRRRQQQRVVFERLGAPDVFTTRPALVEGLLGGLAGGLLAAVGSWPIAVALTAFERATVPSAFTITTISPGGASGSGSYHLPVARIAESPTHVLAVALVVLAGGAVLGVAGAALTTRRAKHPLDSEW